MRSASTCGGTHLDREPEPVEQLRPQLALLGVAGADQHEARGVAHREPLALDDVLARLRHVEQQVDEVVLEQVDLVDVEEAAMGARQQAGLEALDALGQRFLQVERADDAILRRAERQVDHRHRRLDRWQRAGGLARAALVAERGAGRRVAAVAAALDHLHARQQR